MSHGSMPQIYQVNGVSLCHTCGAESLVICRACTHGFCREHFQMCTECHEWMCNACFDAPARHTCQPVLSVIQIRKPRGVTPL